MLWVSNNEGRIYWPLCSEYIYICQFSLLMFFSSSAAEGGMYCLYEDFIKAQCFPFSHILDISDNKYQSKYPFPFSKL